MFTYLDSWNHGNRVIPIAATLTALTCSCQQVSPERLAGMLQEPDGLSPSGSHLYTVLLNIFEYSPANADY